MQSLQVIRQTEQAQALLHPERGPLLARLRNPASASAVARDLGLPRQKVNYHLRALEKVGLVTLVAERKARNCTERVVQAVARCFVLSPELLAELGNEAPSSDQLSSAYLLATTANTLAEVGLLRSQAELAGKRLATLSLEGDICFASSADRNAYAEELTALLSHLNSKYHQPSHEGSREFRLKCAIYPKPLTEGDVPTSSPEKEPKDDD